MLFLRHFWSKIPGMLSFCMSLPNHSLPPPILQFGLDLKKCEMVEYDTERCSKRALHWNLEDEAAPCPLPVQLSGHD